MIRKKPFILSSFCLSIMVMFIAEGSAFPADEGLISKELAEQIDGVVEKRMAEAPLAGVARAIVHEGEQLLAKGYGWANLKKKRAVEPDTPFQIASLAKQFASVSIMLLVKEGKLTLDKKVDAILEGMPAGWSDITVRHLLNHTAGIKDYAKFEDLENLYQTDLTRKEILKHIYAHDLEFPPGTKWAYSNCGYYLVGMIIEKISGMSYGD